MKPRLAQAPSPKPQAMARFDRRTRAEAGRLRAHLQDWLQTFGPAHDDVHEGYGKPDAPVLALPPPGRWERPSSATAPNGSSASCFAITSRTAGSTWSSCPAAKCSMHPMPASRPSSHAPRLGNEADRARPPSRIALALIRVYKFVLSPLFAGSCRYMPGCADYMTEVDRALRIRPRRLAGHQAALPLPPLWRSWFRSSPRP